MNTRYSFPTSPLQAHPVAGLPEFLPKTSDPIFAAADFAPLLPTYNRLKGGWRKGSFMIPDASNNMKRLLALKPARGRQIGLEQEFEIITALATIRSDGSATDKSTAAFRRQTQFLLTLQQTLARHRLWTSENYRRLKLVTDQNALFQISVELQNFVDHYDIHSSAEVQAYLNCLVAHPYQVAPLAKVLNLFHQHHLGRIPDWVLAPDHAHRLPLLARLIDFSMKNQLNEGISKAQMLGYWQAVIAGGVVPNDFNFEGAQQSIATRQIDLPQVLPRLQIQDEGDALREFADQGIQVRNGLTVGELTAVMQTYNQNRGWWKKLWNAVGFLWMSQSTAMRKLDLQLTDIRAAQREAGDARVLGVAEEFAIITTALEDERQGSQTAASLSALKKQHHLVFQMAKSMQQAGIYTADNYAKWRGTFGTEHYYKLTSAIIDFFSKVDGVSPEFLQSAFDYLIAHQAEADHVVDFLRICVAEGLNPNDATFSDIGQHNHYVALYNFIRKNNIEGFSLDAIAVHSKNWAAMPNLNELQSLVHIGAISLSRSADTLKILSNCGSHLDTFLQNTQRIRENADGLNLESFKFLLEVVSKRGAEIGAFTDSYLLLVAGDQRQHVFDALVMKDEGTLLQAIRDAVPAEDQHPIVLDENGPNLRDDLIKELRLRNDSEDRLGNGSDVFTPCIQAVVDALADSPVVGLYREALVSENDRAPKNLVELLGNVVQSAIENGITDFAALNTLQNVDILHNLVFLMVGEERDRIINPSRIDYEGDGCGNPTVGFLVDLANKFHANGKDYTSALTLIRMLQEKNIFSDNLQQAIIQADNIDVIDMLHDFFHQMGFDFTNLDERQIARLWTVIPDVPKFNILLEFQQNFSLSTDQVVTVLENTGKQLNAFLIQSRDIFIASRPDVSPEIRKEVFMNLSYLLQRPKGVERLTQLVTIYKNLNKYRPELRNHFFNSEVIDRLVAGIDKEEQYFNEVVHIIQTSDKATDIPFSGIMDFAEVMCGYGFSSQAIFDLVEAEGLSLDSVDDIQQTIKLWMSRYTPASYVGAHQTNVEERDSNVLPGNRFAPAKTDRAYWKFNKSTGMVEAPDIRDAVESAKSVTGQGAKAPSDRMFEWLVRTACNQDAGLVVDDIRNPNSVIAFPKGRDGLTSLSSAVYIASAAIKEEFQAYSALVAQAANKYGVVASSFYRIEEDLHEHFEGGDEFGKEEEEQDRMPSAGVRVLDDEEILVVDEGRSKLFTEIQDRREAIIGLAKQGLFGIAERELDAPPMRSPVAMSAGRK